MGTTLSSQSLVAAWEQFLTDYYKGRIEEAALNYPDTRSIEVDYNDIDRRDPNLAQYTLDHPRASIQSAEDAAKLIEVPVEPRPFLRIRIRNVPRVNRYMIRKLRAEHLGKFVAIEGLIKKGMHFAVCQLATRRNAGIIAQQTGAKAEEIYRELTSNLIPNAHMVPAGIVAVNRAQERGYSFISVT